MRAAIQRLILPVIFAIGLIGAVEFAIDIRYHPTFWQKTTWLLHDPYKGEALDRAVVYEKLSHFEDSDPEVISVGDSSGFFGLQSRIVNRFTGGHPYISLNTGANQAYSGYQGIAEYMLRRSHNLRYVVIYTYPQLMPAQGLFKDADLAPILQDDLVGVMAAVTPPSAFLSPYAKFRIFDAADFHFDKPMSSSVPELQLHATISEALGWLPEFDVRFDRVSGRGGFFSDQRPEWYQGLGLSDPSMINATLDRFERMVRSHGAHLVIAYAPTGSRAVEHGDTNVLIADRELARFQREHPDVKFLFPLITPWGSEKFGMLNHVSREYTFLSSERLGKALARLFADPDSIKPFTATYQEPPPFPTIVTESQGRPDSKLLDSALALYLYASTGDSGYRDLIAQRDLRLLEGEAAFRYMMDDEIARAASQRERGITIGFDLSQLTAIPVRVSGMPFCTDQKGLQWIQIFGSMIFTYKTPQGQLLSVPVKWPETSHILVPTVIEDGIRKFDGYCPEPSMTDREQAETNH